MPKIWEVVYEGLCIDRLDFIIKLVYADSKDEAISKFNAWRDDQAAESVWMTHASYAKSASLAKIIGGNDCDV